MRVLTLAVVVVAVGGAIAVGQSTVPSADGTKTGETEKAVRIASPGEHLDAQIKKGSEQDVEAVGTRKIGGRGVKNWYSTNWELGVGQQYSMAVEKTSHLVTDPVVVEYVNRIGQNLVRN